ncbi:MAG: hypothetical protein IPI42_05650 [Saprospiraceae bacterium]|nr:hypothetical protein [Candidatus Parvibacillus calidus]
MIRMSSGPIVIWLSNFLCYDFFALVCRCLVIGLQKERVHYELNLFQNPGKYGKRPDPSDESINPAILLIQITRSMEAWRIKTTGVRYGLALFYPGGIGCH